MRTLTKIAFLLLRIASLVFMVLYVLGVIVSLLTGRIEALPSIFVDVLIYTFILYFALKRFQNLSESGEKANWMIKSVLLLLLVPLIFLSSYFVYDAFSKILFQQNAAIFDQSFIILLFSCFAFSGGILLKALLFGTRTES